jgi:hypothetical protein
MLAMQTKNGRKEEEKWHKQESTSFRALSTGRNNNGRTS